MGYILIDTCIWIDLASTPAMESLVKELLRVAPGKPHAIVVPSSVKIEFERNKKDITKRWETSLRGHIGGVKELRRLVPQMNNDISNLIANANSALEIGRLDIERATSAVSEVLSRGSHVEHEEADYREACQRSLEHRPPAISPKRSSIGDILLWLTALRLLDKHCVWFCTKNYHDFSDTERFDKLHPTLEDETKSKNHKLHYFTDPSKLLESLMKLEGIKPPETTITRYEDYFPGSTGSCPNCNTKLIDSGSSPSHYGGWTWKMRCPKCGSIYDTGEFIDN